ncbi:MAG: hypothetical protein ACREQE_07250, partial [Candidatus Binataceae bacterium]
MRAGWLLCATIVTVKSTPLITQYLSVKQRVPDAILFFRLGDFYEMFFEDAEVGARVLDIQLTSRSKDGVPLCGVPYHAAEPYIARLLKAGLKVAICEQGTTDAAAGSSHKGAAFQLSAPNARAGRGLMPRQIVRVITPGTVSEEMVLSADEKSFLLALASDHDGFALAALDVSTGEFIATRLTSIAGVREEIARLGPREILTPSQSDRIAEVLFGLNYPLTVLDDGRFEPSAAKELLRRRFDSSAEMDDALAAAAAAALGYVEDNFGRELAHLRPPRLYRAAEYMLVDETSRAHLELITSSDGTRAGSLAAILDETLTPVGARTLANWTVYPLLELDEIRARHDAVEELFDLDLGGATTDALKQ